jgi:hypothetical protein
MDGTAYSAITNEYAVVDRPPAVCPLLLCDLDTKQRLARLVAFVQLLDGVGIDLDVRLTTAEGSITGLELSQLLQDEQVAALTASQLQQDEQLEALDASQLQQGEQLLLLDASQSAQEEQLAVLESSQALQTEKIEVLQTGFMLSARMYSEGPNGGAALVIKQNGENIVDELGEPATAAVSMELATYDESDQIAASVLLQGNLVTIGPNIRIPGDLLLGVSSNTVQAQLDDLEERILQEVIALASNYALDAVQQGLISALSLLLKPKGYEALPDIPSDEDFPDSNSITPIRLFPAGKFSDELPDELGNIVERINSKGKITVSADVLPTRTMTVGRRRPLPAGRS